MDRRQKKTRSAVFAAFTELLAKKNYTQITVQEIIDAADIGRSTFYAHFETRDDLLRQLCEELFDHIISSVEDAAHTHGRYSDQSAPKSVFCHLLLHINENDRGILDLLSCTNSHLFLQYFKSSLTDLLWDHLNDWVSLDSIAVPEDFLINHISSTFVDMVEWWIVKGRKESPEQLTAWFDAVILPVFKTQKSETVLK